MLSFTNVIQKLPKSRSLSNYAIFFYLPVADRVSCSGGELGWKGGGGDREVNE